MKAERKEEKEMQSIVLLSPYRVSYIYVFSFQKKKYIDNDRSLKKTFNISTDNIHII
jgi:hypothetical protein